MSEVTISKETLEYLLDDLTDLISANKQQQRETEIRVYELVHQTTFFANVVGVLQNLYDLLRDESGHVWDD